MIATPREQLKKLRTEARRVCDAWPLRDVQFSINTGWAENYEDLFSAAYTHVLREEEILDRVLKQGRAILSGRAGDGKTWLLRRRYKEILDRGDVPILLDLKQWTHADYEQWQDWTSSGIGDAADFLVRRFSGLGIGVTDIDRLPPDVSKFLLVDGLNEITSGVGAQVLQLLDELVREQINLSVLVADRLIRRELPSASRWSIGALLPLSDVQIHKHLHKSFDKSSGILTSPFFLDATIKYKVEGSRRSQACESFLLTHAKIKETEFEDLAAAAFDAYQKSGTRVFDRAPFVELAGEAVANALELAGVLVSEGEGRSYFSHHIVHDYLAARHFSSLPVEGWNSKALSELSFDASSFDAVELVFEQLGEGRTDSFLRQLYDWNLYAAGYALAQARDADVCVGSEMRTMIFAMLAEKRFDSVLATRRKAGDALALMQLSDAQAYRDAQSLERVFEILDSVESEEGWFNEWKELFQTRSDSQLGTDTLETIRNLDSITGWTVANVAKRSRVAEGTPDQLVQWLKDEPNATVRWRIAHVLGAFPIQVSLEALLQLLDSDLDSSVRYGAIRSIVELAARGNKTFREVVSFAVDCRADAISGQPKISNELRTSLLQDADLVGEGWLSFVSAVVKALFVVNEDTLERDLWRGCLGMAETLYSRQNGVIG